MSGIYIPGMEMPIVCEGKREGCRFADFYFGDKTCYLTGDYIEYGKLNKNCPLIPVPEHGKLIDADALLKHEGVHDYKYELGTGKIYVEIDDIVGAVADAPTIIPADPAKEGEG